MLQDPMLPHDARQKVGKIFIIICGIIPFKDWNTDKVQDFNLNLHIFFNTQVIS